jgi:hypothetical protein
MEVNPSQLLPFHLELMQFMFLIPWLGVEELFVDQITRALVRTQVMVEVVVQPYPQVILQW